MKPEKPTLFIGSSQEARSSKIVDEFVTALREDAYPTPWYQVTEFSESGSVSSFSALCTAANAFDYAVFLLTPDDDITSRDTTKKCPRDNVVFELGLFVGAIGPDRVQAFVQETDNGLKIPSDVLGIQMPRFYFNSADMAKSRSSVNTETRGLARKIQVSGFRKIDLQIAHEWSFDSRSQEFKVSLSAAKLTRVREVIGRWKVVLAARLFDEFVNFEDDERVVYSQPRALPDTVNHDIPLLIPGGQFRQQLEAPMKFEGRLLLIPESLDIDPATTVKGAIAARCRDVECVSYGIKK